MSSPSVPLNALMQYRMIMNQIQSANLEGYNLGSNQDINSSINFHTIRLPLNESTRPTAQDFIDSLQEITITNETETCSICLEEFQEGDIAIQLPCKDKPHLFHKQTESNTCCGVIPWLLKNNSCPVCRTVFPCEETPTDQDMNTGSTQNENLTREEIVDMIIAGIQEMIQPIEQDLEQREQQDLQNALIASLQD